MNNIAPTDTILTVNSRFLSTSKQVKTASQQPIILSDFDGTISEKDVTDTLLSHFGKTGCDELEELWLAGKIGSQECMSKQIALLDASLDEVNQVLSEMKIDPDFKAFVHAAERNKIPVHVVSDGLDYAIRFILEQHGLGHLPIFANQLLHDNQRGWRLAFPYANKGCIKGSGNCKCNHVKQQQLKQFNPILYVGDGTSDFCVSNRVDLVFAKDKLITYCQEHNLNYCAINSFADVTDAIEKASYLSSIQAQITN
ncbi:MtnX-like HAD-IB family phosphatase [Orbaceae bacterium ESL0721]|nr:MtnX-like HAD-IB family phosphatase [Orbaceae bacterium ESL0721]